jgi:hypothetical protein
MAMVVAGGLPLHEAYAAIDLDVVVFLLGAWGCQSRRSAGLGYRLSGAGDALMSRDACGCPCARQRVL